MKKKMMIFYMAVFLIMFLLLPFENEVEAAAKKIKGFDFICLIVENMADRGNVGCDITTAKNGSLIVNGTELTVDDYGKYMKKYKLTEQKACEVAAAVKIGLVKGNLKAYKKKITVAKALGLMSKADYIANGTAVAKSDIDYCIKYRIGDIKKTKKAERRGEAEGYIRGFIKGSAKKYSHKRTLKGKNKLTSKNAKKMLEMLYDTSKRCVLSPDFQITRLDKLPRNAELYPYIVASFPNSYYETGFNGMSNKNFFDKGVGLGADTLEERMKRTSFSFVFPYEIEKFNSLDYPGEAFSYENQVFTETYRNNIVPNEMVTSSEEFYRYALNIDYRTIEKDTEWQNVMKKYLTEDELDNYIEHCKANKTIIECDIVAADRSSVYWYNGEYNCKVYAHMRIVSDIPTELGRTMGTDQDTYGYLYPVKRGYEPGTLYTRSVLGEMYLDYKVGDWIDMYFNTSGSSDMYGCLCCSNTSRGIMIDYSGLYPWLIAFPFAS